MGERRDSVTGTRGDGAVREWVPRKEGRSDSPSSPFPPREPRVFKEREWGSGNGGETFATQERFPSGEQRRSTSRFNFGDRAK